MKRQSTTKIGVTARHALSYTYGEYLQAWRERFGDADRADYEYYVRGKRVPCEVSCLSRMEFQRHLEQYEYWDREFTSACEAGDDEKMDRALRASFPHELALLW